MMSKKELCVLILSCSFIYAGCGSKDTPDPPPTPPAPPALVFQNAKLGNVPASAASTTYNIKTNAALRLLFNNAVDRSTAAAAVTVKENGTNEIAVNTSFENGDSTIVFTPLTPLKYITKYSVDAASSLKSIKGGALNSVVNIQFVTQIDSSRKFPILSDNALLDLVQQQTFKYFWDFGHPVSGLARERNTSGDMVTSGGSGFGIMSIPVGIYRNFITRAQGLTRMQTIVAFLKNTAVKVKGAFPHWLSGSSGAIIPFSANDNGADIVETSYLMMGLLTARQYFNGADAAETNLRSDINTLYNNVEWDWFRNGGQNVLYWHYSPDKLWAMNIQVKGWNESLITYIMAASSTTHNVPATVYNNGWKTGPNFINGNSYYGYMLPLGPPQGGPLFFSHYTFLGVNPNGLVESGINYTTQTKNHTLINYNYCKANLANHFGYSDSTWGLTASDIENGYAASSPTNDLSFIAPTAALSSFPYTPAESMAALKFYYYVLGNKLWSTYGFVDAFSLEKTWFATSTLAIDQGPIILMIENYRTGLLWNLFTSCPEVKAGMQSLGFTAPYL